MNALALLSPTTGQRSPTTNEAVTCGCRDVLTWTVRLRANPALTDRGR